ncbi:MAG: hypothetical protein J7K20_03830 [Thermodesulfobacterium sp.]|nr:hypothetical protein [Thermodesulfobacterium sp.]
MKKVLTKVVTLFFVFGFVACSYAAQVCGTIKKIEDNKITIEQADGKTVTVELKVGDKITIDKGEKAQPTKKKVRRRRAIEGC